MKQIKVTEKEKKLLEPFVNERLGALATLRAVSKIVGNAEQDLMTELLDLWPGAVKLHHPTHGDWSVEVTEKETK